MRRISALLTSLAVAAAMLATAPTANADDPAELDPPTSATTGQGAAFKAPDDSATDVEETELPESIDEITEPLQGEDAVEVLGDDIDGIAAEYEVTGTELEEILLSDEGIWVGPGGRLIAAAPAAPNNAVGVSFAEAANWDWNTISNDDVFNLNSKPGANKTVYLNFQGWKAKDWGIKKSKDNAWTYPYPYGYGMPMSVTGFNWEGSANSFTASERRIIRWVWAAVAEDFAAFDVNVTTKKPSLATIERSKKSDKKFGTMVVISSQDYLSNYVCGNCSGVAWIGTVDHYKGKKYNGKKDNTRGRAFQPAWVFATAGDYGLVGGSATFLANTITHEAGHNLGLLHTGLKGGEEYYDGHGNWSPLMGTSQDYVSHNIRPLSQWVNSKKKINGSATKEKQDQIAVMKKHGFTTRKDEAGSSFSSSKPITSGVISSASDKDTVVIGQCSVNRTLNVETATMANLDAKVELLDASGNVISTHSGNNTGAVATGQTGLGFQDWDRKPSNTGVTFTIPAGGPYHVRISGEGSTANAYSNYGSIGQWRFDNPCLAAGGVAPGAPAKFKATAGDKSAKVSWNWPATGRIQDITGWRVKDAKTGKSLKKLSAGTLSTTVTGLKIGKTVQLEVVALTAGGESEASPAVAVKPFTKPGKVGKPKAKHGKNGGKITAKLSWKRPKVNSSAVTAYQIRAFQKVGGKWKKVKTQTVKSSKKSVKYEIKLKKKGSYKFTVRAKNKAGYGTWSKKSKAAKGR